MEYTREQILKQLTQVIDPELGLNIVALGLVYDVSQINDEIRVSMTLTTPGCPMMTYFRNEVESCLNSLDGIKSVNLLFVFTPPWSPEMIDHEAAAEL